MQLLLVAFKGATESWPSGWKGRQPQPVEIWYFQCLYWVGLPQDYQSNDVIILLWVNNVAWSIYTIYDVLINYKIEILNRIFLKES